VAGDYAKKQDKLVSENRAIAKLVISVWSFGEETGRK
jgi:hypothetical protein